MSTRNNEERLGAAQIHSDSPITQPSQDLLNFVVPTMFVELPSKGQFYPENHPLHNEETIEIRFMTAKDEDTLNSPTLIKQGVVLDRLIQSLILSPNIRSEDLLIGDKNAILIEARISGYGSGYEVKVACPSCGEEQEQEFDLEECRSVYNGFEDGFEGIKLLESGTFLVKLPKTQVECEFRLLMGHDEKHLMAKRKKGKLKKKDQDLSITKQTELMIVSLNGEPDPAMISYFAENMPVQDARYLRKAYEKVNPTTNLSTEFECESCGYTEDMEVPLSVGFFWPK